MTIDASRASRLESGCDLTPRIKTADGRSEGFGATDFMHDAAETEAYWRASLPDAHFVRLPHAGRFISYSHPDEIVSRLSPIAPALWAGTSAKAAR